MGCFIDLTGLKFGRLTVLSKGHKENGMIYWNCECDCNKGVSFEVKSVLLRYGKTKSCGCLKKETVIQRNTTHGMGHSKLNMVWSEMKSRCTNSNHKRYSDYGGRGITVCESWNKFENFYNDMHASYSEGLTLDRIDNSSGYCKENCRWVSALEQNNNKRNNVYETAFGIKATRSELCDMFKIPRCTFYYRLNKGMTIEQALTPRETKLN